MDCEFITAGMPMPVCMLFPKALLPLSISSTAKIMYCLILDAVLNSEIKDENGTLFVCLFSAFRACGWHFKMYYDCWALFKRVRKSRIDYENTSRIWETKQNLCTCSKKGELI